MIKIDKSELEERVVPDPKMKRLHGPNHPWNKRASAAFFKKNGRYHPRPFVETTALCDRPSTGTERSGT